MWRQLRKRSALSSRYQLTSQLQASLVIKHPFWFSCSSSSLLSNKQSVGHTAMMSPDNSTLLHLRELLGPDFASQLATLVNRVGVTQAAVRVEAHVCSTGGDQAGSVVVGPLAPCDRLITYRLPKGYLDLQSARHGNPTPISSPGAQVCLFLIFISLFPKWPPAEAPFTVVSSDPPPPFTCRAHKRSFTHTVSE